MVPSLKPYSLPAVVICFISLTMAACNFMPGPGEHAAGPPLPHQISRSVDSSLFRLAGGRVLKVIPGTSVGSLQLKMEWEQAPVFDYFGKPDSMDAAMCKNWAMWYWRDQKGQAKELDIYAACDPDLEMQKSIQVIRIRGCSFLTTEGIGDTTRLTTLKNKLSDISKLGTFSDPLGNKVSVWDDIATGVAFEVSLKTSAILAIIVHEPGKKITDFYLPFYHPVATP